MFSFPVAGARPRKAPGKDGERFTEILRSDTTCGKRQHGEGDVDGNNREGYKGEFDPDADYFAYLILRQWERLV
ncbi:MAG: hypothetical protein J7J77_03510, partial [Candidatus Cloacimonetes bacterium]|nr:hypothetical protein [Candidatus Cloacimonadota bacterium]